MRKNKKVVGMCNCMNESGVIRTVVKIRELCGGRIKVVTRLLNKN